MWQKGIDWVKGMRSIEYMYNVELGRLAIGYYLYRSVVRVEVGSHMPWVRSGLTSINTSSLLLPSHQSDLIQSAFSLPT